MVFKPQNRRANVQQNSMNSQYVSGEIIKDKQTLCLLLNQITDLVTRDINKGLLLAYIEGLTDDKKLNDNVIEPLLNRVSSTDENLPIQSIITLSNISLSSSWQEIADALLQGSSVLFVQGESEAYILKTQGWKERSITEPQNESSIFGSHQGFIENSQTNIALIRRYLPDKELKIIEHVVGLRGKSKLSILYLHDVANPDVVQELQDRIEKINVDALINTGEITEHIEDNSFTLFPQFLLSERPDTTASELLQGRAVVVFDRSPSVLIGPYSIGSFFQTVDDYSTRWIAASFIRLLRYIAFFVAIFLPSLYIATISFHFEILPLHLIISVGESRVNVPLTPIMEAFLMEITIEMLREAAIRLPTSVGQTVGVVGGIIIGQAAVQAGIVSNIMVIIVALTAIASFMLPNQDFASSIRFIRFPIMFMAAMFGMVGIMIALMILIAHITSLESLGTPYGSPYAPLRFKDLKDTLIRVPMRWMNQRPLLNRPQQFKRQGSGDQEK